MLLAVLLATISPVAKSADVCEAYCANPCSQFAHPDDTVDECSGCTDDGNNQCFPGAPGYGSSSDSAPAAEADGPSDDGENTDAKVYEGIEVMDFDSLKNDKRMKMVVFHWAGEKGGDELVATMQELRKNSKYADYLWFHLDVSADSAARAEFKQENLPMTFSQTPEDGIAHFNGGDFNVENFEKWHSFRMGEGWKASDKVIRLEKEDLPHKLEELAKKQPVFLKMYEEWCHHCKSLKPHFKRSSNEVDGVTFVEVECSKSGGFCDHFFPGSGFPRVRLLNKGGNKAHDYKGLTYLQMTEFGNNPSKWEFTQDTGFGEEMKDEL